MVGTSIAITETETSIGIGEVAEIETDLVEMKRKGVGVETEVLTTKRLIFFCSWFAKLDYFEYIDPKIELK